MPDMADSPAVKPQLSYLEPPEGSITRNAMLYPPADQLEKWERLLQNPFRNNRQENTQIMEEGAFLYEANCSPCHGKSGKGNGTITDKFPPAPDITSSLYKERADGFFFHKITNGGPIMPSRAEHTYPEERWKIILHLRSLQEG